MDKKRATGEAGVRRVTTVLSLAACCLPGAALAQTNVWDSILSNTNWYVPVPNLVAYMTGAQSFIQPPPLAIGDQTLWSWGPVVNGVISGTSNAQFYIGSQTVATSPLLMNGMVTDLGQLFLKFTPEGGGTTTLGIGQIREIGGVPLAEMQMITGSGTLVTHWAYMAPYNPATFTPPPPSQYISANVTSPEWRWTAGKTWQIVSPTLFGSSTPGTFKISAYDNGYFWGLGAGPTNGSAGNFTQLGSITPEGNVLFGVLADSVLSSLTGGISGDGSTGEMVLQPFDLSGPYGTAAVATLMPVTNINSGMVYFASDLGTIVNPVFAGGTLQIDVNSATYAQNFTVDASGTNTIDQRGNAATFSGVFSDAVPGSPGSLVIANSGPSGSITLTGASTYTGPTTVEPGATLVVDGSLVSPVTVGGMLGGRGTVGAIAVGAGGVLAPGTPGGNTIATLSASGGVSFAAGSTYAVDISTSGADRVSAGGAATLSGGTVLAAFGRGAAYSARPYTLLSAAGGRAGTFDQLVTLDLPAGLAASLSYGPTEVELGLTAILGAGTVLTGNESTVAGAINGAFNRGATLPSGLQGVFGLTGAGLASALGSLSGETQSGVQAAAFGFGAQFLDTVAAVAGGGAGAGGTGPQQALQYASIDANEAVGEPRRLHAWVSGFGGHGWLGGGGAAGSSAVQTTGQGLAIGADWSFDHGSLGVAVASGTMGWTLDGGQGSGQGNVFQTGLYGRVAAGPLYVTAAGAWGQQTVGTHRSVPYAADMLAANYTASMWSARVETGHRFALGTSGLTPFVAGQGQWLDVPRVCETSSQNSGAALCYANDASASIRSELGVEADADIGAVFGAPAWLRGRVAWAHEFETTGQISASFAAMPGSGFAVSGAPLPSDAALVRLISDFALDGSWSFRLQADAGFSDRYAAIAGTARLSARW